MSTDLKELEKRMHSAMEALKKEMVSVQNTPETDPRRVEFNRLHHRSVAFEGAVLLLGLAGIGRS